MTLYYRDPGGAISYEIIMAGIEDKGIYLRTMDRESIHAMLHHVLSTEESSGLKPWKEENFMAEFPEKWLHSQWIIREGVTAPIGYAVVSRKTPASVHLHRFVIGSPGQGIGSAAMRLLLDAAARSSTCMTLNTEPNKPRVERFYARLGFSPIFPLQDNLLWVRRLRE
jgi:RimJ/RimL family protein N-acetyltransferase